jgi:hypothetical protein
MLQFCFCRTHFPAPHSFFTSVSLSPFIFGFCQLIVVSWSPLCIELYRWSLLVVVGSSQTNVIIHTSVQLLILPCAADHYTKSFFYPTHLTRQRFGFTPALKDGLPIHICPFCPPALPLPTYSCGCAAAANALHCRRCAATAVLRCRRCDAELCCRCQLPALPLPNALPSAGPALQLRLRCRCQRPALPM